MKKHDFDLDRFLNICKEYGAEVIPGSGKVLSDGSEISLASVAESALAEAKEKMRLSSEDGYYGIINGKKPNEISRAYYIDQSTLVA